MSNDYTETFMRPFGELAINLSDSELREIAYEILVGCLNYSGKTSTNKILESDKNSEKTGVATTTPQTSLTSRATSKVKKVLGLRSWRKKSISNKLVPLGSERVQNASLMKETLRVQMGVSEQMDSIVRKVLSKVAADQKIESIVLPLEMLQHLKPADFPSQEEYEAWQRRNLKLLEAGILLHPLLPLDNDNTDAQRLREITNGASESPSKTIQNNEVMKALRGIVTSLACRTCDDGSVSGTNHWADGFPLNLKIYKMLLEACLDVNNDASVVEELDDVLELIKKTWQVLGMNQMLHNLCFLWIAFNRYTTMDQADIDLLNAGEDMLMKVENDAKALGEDANCAKMLSSISSSISGWAEKRLVDYHSHFRSDNTDTMACVVSMLVLSAKIMAGNRIGGGGTDVGHERVDQYIKSSLRAAFAQVMEKEKSSKASSKDDRSELPFMARLAEEVSKLGFIEKETFSPILKRWHPLAAGVAVATLHSCYGNELKQYVSGIYDLSPDILLVLKHADRLEKDLVQIAVENSVESEDGGKSIIREMHPYEAQSLTSRLVKSWIMDRTDRLKEWVERNLQQEKWDPKATRGRLALSAVEVLRMVDEALEAFFLLPITIHADLLQDVAAGINDCLQQYISLAKAGCGT